MNSIGWQVCGVLLGISAVIVAIYIAKTLNSASKTIDNANGVVNKASKIIDDNEKEIGSIIKSAASITENVDEIVDMVTTIIGYLNIFSIVKKKRKNKKINKKDK